MDSGLHLVGVCYSLSLRSSYLSNLPNITEEWNMTQGKLENIRHSIMKKNDFFLLLLSSYLVVFYNYPRMTNYIKIRGLRYKSVF